MQPPLPRTAGYGHDDADCAGFSAAPPGHAIGAAGRFFGAVTDARVMIVDLETFRPVSSTASMEALSICWLGYALLFTTPTHVRALFFDEMSRATNEVNVGACYNVNSRSTTTTIVEAYPDRVVLLGSVGSSFDCVYVQNLPMLEPMLLGAIAFHRRVEGASLRREAQKILECVPFKREASLSLLSTLNKYGLGTLSIAAMMRPEANARVHTLQKRTPELLASSLSGGAAGLSHLDRFQVALDADDALSALHFLMHELAASTLTSVFRSSRLWRCFERLMLRCAAMITSPAAPSPQAASATEVSTPGTVDGSAARSVHGFCERLLGNRRDGNAIKDVVARRRNRDACATGLQPFFEEAAAICREAAVNLDRGDDSIGGGRTDMETALIGLHDDGSHLNRHNSAGDEEGASWRFCSDEVRYLLRLWPPEAEGVSAAEGGGHEEGDVGHLLSWLPDTSLRREVATIGRRRSSLSIRSSQCSGQTLAGHNDFGNDDAEEEEEEEETHGVRARDDAHRLHIDVNSPPPKRRDSAAALDGSDGDDLAGAADPDVVRDNTIEDDWNSVSKMLSSSNFGDSDSDGDEDAGGAARRGTGAGGAAGPAGGTANSTNEDDDSDEEDGDHTGYVRRRLKLRIKDVAETKANEMSDADSAAQLRKSAAMLKLGGGSSGVFGVSPMRPLPVAAGAQPQAGGGGSPEMAPSASARRGGGGGLPLVMMSMPSLPVTDTTTPTASKEAAQAPSASSIQQDFGGPAADDWAAFCGRFASASVTCR